MLYFLVLQNPHKPPILVTEKESQLAGKKMLQEGRNYKVTKQSLLSTKLPIKGWI